MCTGRRLRRMLCWWSTPPDIDGPAMPATLPASSKLCLIIASVKIAFALLNHKDFGKGLLCQLHASRQCLWQPAPSGVLLLVCTSMRGSQESVAASRGQAACCWSSATHPALPLMPKALPLLGPAWHLCLGSAVSTLTGHSWDQCCLGLQ